jgi:hypothetical protein
MSTKPIKALVALASIALLGSLVTAGSAPALANGGCGLTTVPGGTGTPGSSSNPWQVQDEDDFELVGVGDCGLDGHYLQTASFSVDTSDPAGRVDDLLAEDSGDVIPFSGVYNGDHWQITLAGESDRPLFSTVSGTIKKLQLGGGIVADYPETSGPAAFADYSVGSLAAVLQGGTISEVGSAVNIQVSSASAAVWVGGLVGNSNGSSDLIQYSFYAGDLDIQPGGSGADIGGLVGRGAQSGDFLIRDSYARANVAYGTSGSVQAGGIVGNSNSGVVRFIRTYAAGSFEEKEPCPSSCEVRFFRVGGLLGNSTDSRNLTFVSAFWLESVGANAVGGFGTTDPVRIVQPVRYASGLPVAVAVNAQTLRTISTFQTKEGAAPGAPGGVALPQPDSTRLDDGSAPLDIDYRWAIEFADVSPFVAQKREKDALAGETVSFTRKFDRVSWANSSVPPATYSTRGTTASSSSYPAIGRVWEICTNLDVNNGFPVRVWEGYNCPGEGTGGGGNDRNRETPSDVNLAAAQAAGLSGAELEAFLASGLTLEQWMAQRLAATGTPGEALGLGVAMAGLLTMGGLGLLAVRRRLSVSGVR